MGSLFTIFIIHILPHNYELNCGLITLWMKLCLCSSSCLCWSMVPCSQTFGRLSTLASSPRIFQESASMMGTLTWSGSYLKERLQLSECGSSVSPSYEVNWRWAATDYVNSNSSQLMSVHIYPNLNCYLKLCFLVTIVISTCKNKKIPWSGNNQGYVT